MIPAMIITFLLLIVPLINLTTSQIPNPIRYWLPVTDNNSRQHYAIDKKFWKLTRKGFLSDEDPSSVGKSQDIYVPSEGWTYTFTVKSKSIRTFRWFLIFFLDFDTKASSIQCMTSKSFMMKLLSLAIL